MIRRFSKKRSIVALTALLLLLLTAGAVAFFTASGQGSGTASVGTSSTIALHGATSGTLYPGTSVPVTLTADNPSQGHEQVGTVHLSGIKACTNNAVWNPALNGGNGACPSGSSEVPTCEDFDNGINPDANASDFYMADVAENQDLAGGTSGVALTHGGSLQMNNLSHSQNQCEGVGLYLTLAS